ncbi:hypothetical protein Goarm_006640, partial [Gossypium armourianum]|nr:hypothetical protein [Gossypium armourianum]
LGISQSPPPLSSTPWNTLCSIRTINITTDTVPLVMVKHKESYTFPLLEFYMMINLYGENVEIEGNALTIVKMLHADREGNEVAHLLATEGIRRGETTYLLKEEPLFVANE